jgi:hypothetical protein
MKTLDRGSTGADSLHEVAGIQNYAMQVGQVADTISKGDALTIRLIDAVHSGDSEAVRDVFAHVGVDTRVELRTVDASEAPAAGDRVRTVSVSIVIGPITLSVTVPKTGA